MTEPQPPAWNPDHRPYAAPPQGPPQQPYGAPPQHTAPLPEYGRQATGTSSQYDAQQPQYDAQAPQHSAQQPRHAAAQPPQPTGQPQQYPGGPAQPGQPPQYGEAPQHRQPPQYGQLPQYGQPQYSQPPHYAQPQHGQQSQHAGPHNNPAYQQSPQYPGSQQPPRRPSKAVWLPIGAVALVLLLLVGTVVFVTTRGGDDTAEAELPTATYSDGLTNPSGQPSATAPPTTQPTSQPSQSAQPPSQTTPPGVGERRRTLKDIDTGIHVYDDIYVTPAPGWRKGKTTKYSVLLETSALPGAVLVAVAPSTGWPARLGVAAAVDQMIAADRMKGVKKGAVRTMAPANSNVGSQAEQPYSGRITTQNGIVVSLVARCTTLTGVETVHNVTVTVCAVARRESRSAVFKAADRMLASVARSI
ncbi:hypothetical protein [Kribbella sp. HUAS MG21]|uniref:Uncharacterized protein n=1 Tax=Kribbella sp. HUAS MG21 TaxID=3160966 RepID=A0AAU7THU5_9ACTN